mmetsp:Transcript_66477/g.195002  ORF Transcript_66477/g.195002 Transcript_66477/m.195002 type:complete len:265 (+) Transcript_66477:918-1712(+)
MRAGAVPRAQGLKMGTRRSQSGSWRRRCGAWRRSRVPSRSPGGGRRRSRGSASWGAAPWRVSSRNSGKRGRRPQPSSGRRRLGGWSTRSGSGRCPPPWRRYRKRLSGHKASCTPALLSTGPCPWSATMTARRGSSGPRSFGRSFGWRGTSSAKPGQRLPARTREVRRSSARPVPPRTPCVPSSTRQGASSAPPWARPASLMASLRPGLWRSSSESSSASQWTPRARCFRSSDGPLVAERPTLRTCDLHPEPGVRRASLKSSSVS